MKKAVNPPALIYTPVCTYNKEAPKCSERSVVGFLVQVLSISRKDNLYTQRSWKNYYQKNTKYLKITNKQICQLANLFFYFINPAKSGVNIKDLGTMYLNNIKIDARLKISFLMKTMMQKQALIPSDTKRGEKTRNQEVEGDRTSSTFNRTKILYFHLYFHYGDD